MDRSVRINGGGTIKIQVLHDDKGEIISFSVVKNGVQDGLSLVPKKNQTVTVVNLPAAKGEELGSEDDFARLVERVKGHRIDTSGKKGKLVRKST